MTTTADEVWQLLGELIESQKETARSFQETERRFQETERRFQEGERRFQETERIIKEQNEHLNKELGKLGNRLGEFVEYQVRPAAVRLFRERGIDVREISSDISVQTTEEGIEIDVLVVNGSEAIAIEVKSKLSQEDVDEHLQRLAKFKRILPRYQPLNILGAVAAMVTPTEVARYAYRKGLFVISQSREDLVILNDEKFQPRIW